MDETAPLRRLGVGDRFRVRSQGQERVYVVTEVVPNDGLNDTLVIEEVEPDPPTREVHYGGATLHLTPAQYEELYRATFDDPRRARELAEQYARSAVGPA